MIYRAPTAAPEDAASLADYARAYPASRELHRRAAAVLAGAAIHDSHLLQPFPPFFQSGWGPHKQEVGGRTLIDYWMGHGALLFGHGFAPALEAVSKQLLLGTHLGGHAEVMVRWAELVRELVPSAERVRFTASGTEATLLALRVARCFTGRSRVLKLAGHFHGWHDEALGHFFPTGSSGFNPDGLGQVDVLDGADETALREALGQGDVAGVILEPGGGGSGALPCPVSCLRTLREAATAGGALLVFDETVTGFRHAPGGVQAATGVVPDLTVLGKILSGGLPGAALVGRAEVMAVFGVGLPGEDGRGGQNDQDVEARRQVPHTGTFNANPLSAAAGVATLAQLAGGAPQQRAVAATARLVAGVNGVAASAGIDVAMYGAGSSVFHLAIGARAQALGPGPSAEHVALFAREAPRHAALRRALLLEGVDCHPMHGWVSAVHDDGVIDATVAAFERAFRRLKNEPTFAAPAGRASVPGPARPAEKARLKEIELFIDGRFCPAAAGRTFTSSDPAREEAVAVVALADTADVDRAVRAARRAFDEGPWPRATATFRHDCLLAVAQALEENSETLACLETMDTGLPIQFTRGHVTRAVQNFRYFAAEAERLVGSTHPLDDAYLHIVTREPVGVVAVITPWNAPLGLATHGLAAALTSGNTCVLKPSEHTPMTAGELARIFAALDLPPGILNVVHGPGTPTGEALVGHPGVDAVAFTGASATGRRIMESAARGLKRFVAELGGRSPTLVFADCDLDQAVEGTLLCAFANNGEACVAGSRLFVERRILEPFLERFTHRAQRLTTGDPLRDDTEVGPLISSAHRDHVLALIEEALTQGARLHTGGPQPPDRRGFFVPPTVLSEVPATSRLAAEEVMAPVVAISAFDSEEEAVATANDSPYGLAAYVWSQNPQRIFRVAQRLRTGTVWTNSALVRDIRVPFGGYKQSGVGRVGGGFSINAFTELKNTCVPISPPPSPA